VGGIHKPNLADVLAKSHPHAAKMDAHERQLEAQEIDSLRQQSDAVAGQIARLQEDERGINERLQSLRTRQRQCTIPFGTSPHAAFVLLMQNAESATVTKDELLTELHRFNACWDWNWRVGKSTTIKMNDRISKWLDGTYPVEHTKNFIIDDLTFYYSGHEAERVPPTELPRQRDHYSDDKPPHIIQSPPVKPKKKWGLFGGYDDGAMR
jgi:hypothetical protein